MNAFIRTASVLLASAIATAQSQVAIGEGAIGCTEAGARLDDGTPVAADITFAYDPRTAWLQVTVSNKTPMVAEVASPTITRIYFNAPSGTLTGASLMWQFASGPTQPSFQFGFDANAGDGEDPNRAGCLGTFNFRLASAGIKDGIASADAEFICTDTKAQPLRGPTTFVFQLFGPDVHNLTSEVFAASSSYNAAMASVNVAVKFDGAGCVGSGTVGNGDVCRQAVFLRGNPQLGETVQLCVEGGQQCRSWLGLSATEGPVDFKLFTLPIGMPVLFSYDFGFFPVGAHEFTLPVFVPFITELVGMPFYLTSLHHPYMVESPFGFAPAYSFAVTGESNQPQ